MEIMGVQTVKKRVGRITARGNVPPIPPHVTAYYETAPHENYVYFAEDPETGLVKIGITFAINVMERVRDHERSIGRPMNLLATVRGSRRDERMYHTALESSRSHGEWFRPSPELSAFVAKANDPARATGTYWGEWMVLL